MMLNIVPSNLSSVWIQAIQPVFGSIIHDSNKSVAEPTTHSLCFSLNRNYPDYYYDKKFTTPDGALVHIILIDTVILCGNLDSDFNRRLSQPIRVADNPAADKQWKWINRTLAASKYVTINSRFIVVNEYVPVTVI